MICALDNKINEHRQRDRSRSGTVVLLVQLRQNPRRRASRSSVRWLGRHFDATPRHCACYGRRVASWGAACSRQLWSSALLR